MKASKIIALIGGGLLTATAIGATVAANSFSGIIKGYLSNSTFGFDNEDFHAAAAASDELCQRIGEDGIAMLRNENNTLPYAKKKVNVFGWASTDNGFLLSGIGSGSSTIRDEAAVTLLQAFEKEGWETNKELTKFYTDFNNTSFKGKFGTGNSSRISLIEPPIENYTDELIENCKDFSDQAVVVLSRVCGENVGEIPDNQPTTSGTDQTRHYLHISKNEEAMLDMVCSNFSKVTVIINSSNTMELGFLEDYDVGAALNVGLMGQSGALAIPRILSGDISPSGRTTDTFSYVIGSKDQDANPLYAPSYVNRAATNSNIGYLEGVYVGYRFYETADAEGYWADIDNDYGKGYDGVVQYPFGHGLSYTTFEWTLDGIKDKDGNVITAINNPDPNDLYTFEFSCTNKGDVSGKDVMQLYGTLPYTPNGIEKPSLQLLDFCKTVELEPGKTQKGLTCTFRFYDLASYDCYDANKDGHAGYELDAGDYQLQFKENAHVMKKMAEGKIDHLDVHLDNIVDIDKDPITGNKVENRLTGDNAYGDMPIDGSKAYSETPYQLTRNDSFWDWADSLKKVGAASTSGKGTYTNTAFDQTEMPQTGLNTGLKLFEDGQWNEDLVDEIGDDYDSDLLTELVDELSIAELKKNVEVAGFGTAAMPSIGKPENLDFDGPAGFNQNSVKADRDNGKWTAFPCEVLIGQTWDKSIAYQMGTSVANEGKATGLSGWYAPGVNIHRTPFSGRNYEYYSEDPMLSGKMAAQVVLGAKNHGLYAYVKHFTLSEEGPNPRGVNTWLTEQAYREIYLRPFEIAVKEGKAVAIMTAFNNIGCIWAGSCAAQNVDILRGEWGFRGSVITDYSTGDATMNPTRGIRAGNDIWLNPNGSSGAPLSMSDPTTVYCAKMAARNVLFTLINTHYAMTHYDTNLDEVKVEVGTGTVKTDEFPLELYVGLIDGALIGGAVIWIGLAFLLPVIRKNKAKA